VQQATLPRKREAVAAACAWQLIAVAFPASPSLLVHPMSPAATSKTFEVRKDDWQVTRVVTEELDTDLRENEVLLRVDRLALTANNISYAATGDRLGYWGFFPAEEGWGRIPAMGWGEVQASAHPDVAVGERVWGWFPFSTHLKILAGKVGPSRIVDVSPHRSEYAPVYAQFDRASANPLYDADREDHDSLLRGLFMTSWLVEDFLTVNEGFGASTCLVTSASSKTSIALAYCLKQRGVMECIGLTSPGNLDFCRKLGVYDKVIAYDDVTSLDSARPAVLVDMAGNAGVVAAIHHHFGDELKHSCRIGTTHHRERGSVKNLPGARPEFFFAPTHVKQRSKELGGAELMARFARAYVGFRTFSETWLVIQQTGGADRLDDVYQSVLAGTSNPTTGQVVSMWSREG
jgi:NADPH:quinone reductase-like Zn-dependent oxidoreductase